MVCTSCAVPLSHIYHIYIRRAGVPECLEVDPSRRTALDLADIVPRRSANEGPLEASRMAPPPPPPPSRFSHGFVDDPDVPPLV
ncbi:hypothetical protein EPR50_G00132350 [Perca flavescens]|uniref:Uncharacterized protein n=1 Tax=Perca flavescens TaxID=8167 RepID=A0A484CUI1_PERFV|nr:hypothetical protein EPR50_G00132350 [Perca flavescens]